VADLVDLSATRPLVRTSFSLRDLVEGVARELKRPANVAFENAIPDDLGTISADRERLARALRRLAQNAVDAVPGGRSGKVRVAAEREGEHLVVSVIDDGEGVAPSISERIDEPLFSTKVKGTGLGLTIARALIDEQGGRLSWVSSVGAGSTFKVFLPHA
jgi:signal transduction histidine kinase